MKNKWIGLLLSLIFPGLGHLYLGQVKKGVILLAIYFTSLLLMSVLIGIVPFFIIWIYSMIDVMKATKIINQRLSES